MRRRTHRKPSTTECLASPRPSRLDRSPVRTLDEVGEDTTVLQDDHPVTNALADAHEPGSLSIFSLRNDRIVWTVQVEANDLLPFVGLPLHVLDHGEVLPPLLVLENPLRPRQV